MAKLLTQKQAQNLINEARNDVKEFGFLRFGQALWNILTDEKKTKELTDKYNGQPEDFFHLVDEARILELYYEFFVEK